MHDSFDSLMEAFNAGHTTKIQRTADDLCVLSFDDLPVCFKYLKEAGTVLIFTDLGPLPEKDREEYFAMLLEGNHALFATGGATLSCNADLNITALQYLFSVETVNHQQFLTITENFLDMAQLWRRKCRDFRSGREENSTVKTEEEAAVPLSSSPAASPETMFELQNFLRV